jgi:hypothetical protein
VLSGAGRRPVLYFVPECSWGNLQAWSSANGAARNWFRRKKLRALKNPDPQCFVVNVMSSGSYITQDPDILKWPEVTKSLFLRPGDAKCEDLVNTTVKIQFT